MGFLPNDEPPKQGYQHKPEPPKYRCQLCAGMKVPFTYRTPAYNNETFWACRRCDMTAEPPVQV
jgi:hypothetical protein